MTVAMDLYYRLKKLIPRAVQISLRRRLVLGKYEKCTEIWPIDKQACKKPHEWKGWPEGKQFALVLTHDVDTSRGQQRCYDLMNMETNLGFRSSFYFVPERYRVCPFLRQELKARGFEVGVHGLNHDGRLYSSEMLFMSRAKAINRYLRDWEVVGFRSPAMHHNLQWIHELEIEYDASTFDTDPFEPQPDGLGTIFPLFVNGVPGKKGYIELPYTLPQDFTLFVILRKTDIHIWQQKLEWIAENNGMALCSTHPDYMSFDHNKKTIEEYPAEYYGRFLEFVKDRYKNMYWHALPKEVAAYCKAQGINNVVY